MATFNIEWAWIIPTTPRPVKAFSEGAAKKIATEAGVPWSQVKKEKRGVRAQIRRRGFPDQSKTFRTKGQAETWATQMEASMISGEFRDLSVARGLTVAALLDDYRDNQEVNKQDLTRIKLLKKHLGYITLDVLHTGDCLNYAKVRRGTLSERRVHYERWVARQVENGELDPTDADELRRDARTGDMKLPPIVQDSTIRRDLDLLGCAIAWAQDARKLQLKEHPLPKARKHLHVKNERDRRPTDDELEKLFQDTESPQLQPIVQLAVETAMRRSELCALRAEHIDWRANIVKLPREKADRLKKDRAAGRDVPLSVAAVRILQDILGDRRSGRVFEFEPDSVTQAFSRACRRAGIKDLVFHDLRHHALSNWAERGMSVHELQLIGGHKDLRSLSRYLHGRADTVARKMRRLAESELTIEPEPAT